MLTKKYIHIYIYYTLPIANINSPPTCIYSMSNLIKALIRVSYLIGKKIYFSIFI